MKCDRCKEVPLVQPLATLAYLTDKGKSVRYAICLGCAFSFELWFDLLKNGEEPAIERESRKGKKA